jgi:hypothetical protein
LIKKLCPPMMASERLPQKLFSRWWVFTSTAGGV